MGLGWIKVETVTPDKPEIDNLSDILNVSPNEVLGGLIRLWIWADEQTIDGNAGCVTKTSVDRHSGVTGLADAMLSERVGWLVFGGDGCLTFPNFDRHNGETSKKRALAAKRQADFKKRSGNAKVTQDALPREEKRREEKSKKENPLPPFPPELDTDEFHAAWAVWDKHRCEIKKPLTPTSITQQLRQMAAWGHARAIAAIRHTVAKGWQGLREPDTETPRDKRPAFEDGLL